MRLGPRLSFGGKGADIVLLDGTAMESEKDDDN